MNTKNLRQGPHFAAFRKIRTRQNGFVFIFVVMVIALIGTEIFVLTGVANTMLFETDTAYLRACQRNLVISGLAWAKRNIRNQSAETFNRTTDLDATGPHFARFGEMGAPYMDVQAASLSVTIVIPADKQAEVQIDTSCTCKRRTLTHSDEYHIRL